MCGAQPTGLLGLSVQGGPGSVQGKQSHPSARDDANKPVPCTALPSSFLLLRLLVVQTSGGTDLPLALRPTNGCSPGSFPLAALVTPTSACGCRAVLQILGRRDRWPSSLLVRLRAVTGAHSVAGVHSHCPQSAGAKQVILRPVSLSFVRTAMGA